MHPTSSALDLARSIRDGERTSRETVEACIAAVEAVNPRLNAVVRTRFDEARAEAEAADAHIGPKGPLHGVPCTIKECFALQGMPNTSGLLRRKGIVASEDAVTVARLRAAGAIPVGVTNTSELCMWMESDNRVYGRTNNPYDPTRIVGGSSGGEGAIIGSGASPFGLGSDIGGSIRMPAFFNGVFGHKPSSGLVPSTGQYPAADDEAGRYLCSGPLARKAIDLMPLLRILAGPDGQDAVCQDMELREPSEVDIRGLEVAVIEENGAVGVSRDLRQAQARAAAHLAEQGATLRPIRLSALKKSFDIWSSSLGKFNATPFKVLMGQGEAIDPRMELLRWAVRRSDHTLMATLLAATEDLTSYFPGYRDRMVNLGDALRDEIAELLGEDGVLLYPSFPMVAPRHGWPVLRQLLLRFDYAYTGIWNVVGIPVTQVPLGLNAAGLPLGVQVGAAHGRDDLAIAVAMELERAFGGWVRPC